jgi:hypothetical protein
MNFNILTINNILLVLLIVFIIIKLRKKLTEYMTNDISVYDIDWKDKVKKMDENEIKNNSETIFVLIASFRDDQCPITVKELFAKAKNPQRVFLGIHQQNADEDVDCLDESIKAQCVIKDNIKITKVKSVDAQGPVVARYHSSLLFNNEKYLLIIDSHMRCLQDWDVSLIDMYKECQKKKGDKVILSQYPMEFNVNTNKFPENFLNSTTMFCDAMFNDQGIIQNVGWKCHL